MRLYGRPIDWQPWRWSSRTWLVALAVSLVSSPFVTRWFYLQQVSDVRLPFDLDEFSNRTVPDDENAFKVYATAAAMLHRAETPWLRNTIDEVLIDPEDWDDRLEDWLQQNQTLLATIERASKMERSQDEPPRATRSSSIVQLATEVHLIRGLIQVEALRCIRARDFQRAWEWQRASLRFGRHIGMNGYSVAIRQRRRIRESTYQGIARWAAHPEVSVERLKLARKEIALDLSAANPISEILKYTYVIVKNELESEDASKTLYPEWNRFPQYGVVAAAWEQWHFWTIGEPDVSLRITRQVLVNQLPQSDKLPWDRPPVVRREYPTLFEVTANDSQQPGQLSPDQLAKLLQNPIGQRLVQAGILSAITVGDVAGIDSFTYSARTSGFMIDAVLAAHEYQREFGEFPVLLEDLIPRYLDEIPLDEFDRSPSPIRYRRKNETEAVIWSVGDDQVDDDGRIDPNADQLKPDDHGFRLQIAPITR